MKHFPRAVSIATDIPKIGLDSIPYPIPNIRAGRKSFFPHAVILGHYCNFLLLSEARGELKKVSPALDLLSAFWFGWQVEKTPLSTSNMSLLNNTWEAITSCNDIITRIMSADCSLSWFRQNRRGGKKHPRPWHIFLNDSLISAIRVRRDRCQSLPLSARRRRNAS